MRIAIAMRKYEDPEPGVSSEASPECFAEFEVDNDQGDAAPAEDDDTVQVTVVLRGRRGELENPALGMTELVLRALQARTSETADNSPRRDVIDAMGIAVEPMYAS
jgi:hypothetical protein